MADHLTLELAKGLARYTKSDILQNHLFDTFDKTVAADLCCNPHVDMELFAKAWGLKPRLDEVNEIVECVYQFDDTQKEIKLQYMLNNDKRAGIVVRIVQHHSFDLAKQFQWFDLKTLNKSNVDNALAYSAVANDVDFLVDLDPTILGPGLRTYRLTSSKISDEEVFQELNTISTWLNNKFKYKSSIMHVLEQHPNVINMFNVDTEIDPDFTSSVVASHCVEHLSFDVLKHMLCVEQVKQNHDLLQTYQWSWAAAAANMFTSMEIVELLNDFFTVNENVRDAEGDIYAAQYACEGRLKHRAYTLKMGDKFNDEQMSSFVRWSISGNRGRPEAIAAWLNTNPEYSQMDTIIFAANQNIPDSIGWLSRRLREFMDDNIVEAFKIKKQLEQPDHDVFKNESYSDLLEKRAVYEQLVELIQNAYMRHVHPSNLDKKPVWPFAKAQANTTRTEVPNIERVKNVLVRDMHYYSVETPQYLLKTLEDTPRCLELLLNMTKTFEETTLGETVNVLRSMVE